MPTSGPDTRAYSEASVAFIVARATAAFPSGGMVIMDLMNIVISERMVMAEADFAEAGRRLASSGILT